TVGQLPGLSQSVVIDDWFSGRDPWPVGSPSKLALLKHLEQRVDPLESEETRTKVGSGVATGADKVFITDNPNVVESSRLLPLAVAADIVSGSFDWTGRYLINPWDEQGLVELDQYPKLKQYFLSHQEALGSRHVAKK